MGIRITDGQRDHPHWKIFALTDKHTVLLIFKREIIAVDPQFLQNRRVYLFSTHNISRLLSNRVSCFLLKDSLINETIILDNIPAAQIHDGGRIAFGPDSLLYVTTGDTANEAVQDIGNLSGKILRMNKDGSVSADNPFGNLVFAYGIRNSKGLT